jgi:nucleotide-binding universal stress UspA family protein
MIRSIFSPMTVRTFDTSATTVAVKLTKVLNGQLLAFFMRPDPRLSIPYVGDGLTADVIQTLCDATEKEGKEATRSAMDHVEGLCKKMAVNYKEGSESDKSMNPPAAYFEGKICYLKEKVGRMARVADLSVVPQPNDKNSPDGEDMLNELILGSGRPLMMVPEGNFKVTGHTVMIAWNGRSESARAVAAALPILHEASKIIAITIGSDHVGRPSLQELARYLKIHGLDMEEMQVKNSGAAIGEQLLKSAADKGVNLLVSGAYSHSRWREKILGGVTKYIVQHAKIPLFMSH